MTNFEKFEKELIEIDNSNSIVAISKKTGKPCNCAKLSCMDCLFNPECNETDRMKWAMSEYKPIVDWVKVEDNTLVRVKQEYGDWLYRHFCYARYDIEEEKFHYYAYPYGIDKEMFERNKEADYLKVIEYKYCELAEE